MTQRLDSIAHLILSRSAVPAERGSVALPPLPSILSLGREIMRFGTIAAALDRSRRGAVLAKFEQARAVQSVPCLVVSTERSAS